MNTALGSNGTLKVPFEGSAAGNASIVSTWTFIPSAVPDKECQISIWRYLTREDAQYAFLKRVSNLELGYKRTGDDVYYEDPAIQYRVLQLSVPSSPRNDNNLMIVIEGTMTNAAVESLVVRPIKASVFNAALADNTSIMEVVSPTSTVSLSSKFNILVRVSYRNLIFANPSLVVDRRLTDHHSLCSQLRLRILGGEDTKSIHKKA